MPLAFIPRCLPSLGLVALLCLAGCTPPLTLGQQQERSRLALLDYPAEAPYGENLDIVADRQDDQLHLINRTPRAYRDVVIWLNQQYVRELPRITIGSDNHYDLTRFVNEHREPFPVGTLLAPDRAFPLVLAELYDPQSGQRHRLLTWPDDTTP